MYPTCSSGLAHPPPPSVRPRQSGRTGPRPSCGSCGQAGPGMAHLSLEAGGRRVGLEKPPRSPSPRAAQRAVRVGAKWGQRRNPTLGRPKPWAADTRVKSRGERGEPPRPRARLVPQGPGLEGVGWRRTEEAGRLPRSRVHSDRHAGTPGMGGRAAGGARAAGRKQQAGARWQGGSASSWVRVSA